MSAILSANIKRNLRAVDENVNDGESLLCKKYHAHGGYGEDAIIAIKNWERTQNSPYCTVSLVEALDNAGYLTIEEAAEVDRIRAQGEYIAVEEVKKKLGIE